MKQDLFDIISEQWARERPDLDPSGIEVVGRILMLSNHLKRSDARKLAKYGLNIWAYEVLSTLRRQGAPFRLSPTELSKAAMLSSGAMTNRLDRLEASRLIKRIPDPNDRRGLLIELTPKGQEVVDRAVEARFNEATESVTVLSASEHRTLIQLLRKLLAPRGIKQQEPKTSKNPAQNIPLE